MGKLSIITINYNDGNGLEKTIQSVISQTNSDYEFMVIDGGSADNSLDIIKKYADKINYWVSEKDKGIYDAQNKGIAKANGDYILFLNSGDCFYNENVISKFYDYLLVTSRKVIYGNTNIIDQDGSAKVLYPPETLNLNFWYANTLNHQAIFTHSSLFRKYGEFSTHYKYASDFDFLFKVFVNEPSEFAYFNCLICNYDNTGLTSKGIYHKIILKERKEIILSYVGPKRFGEMRREFLNTLSLERKYMIIITENIFLKTILKPVYRLYKYVMN